MAGQPGAQLFQAPGERVADVARIVPAVSAAACRRAGVSWPSSSRAASAGTCSGGIGPSQ
ncbi:MAG TPA: hypothetical protein VF940_34135 [Streptosporangiaceae bacterium]